MKLTPAVFILYFIVTGRWRAAAVADRHPGRRDRLAAAVAPHASSTYFAAAMWDTDRVGALSYVANQSLMGLVARSAAGPTRSPAVDHSRGDGAVRVGVAGGCRGEPGDDRVGFALTGLTACLISPVTWVHHLVWLLPGLVVLVAGATQSSTD